MATMTLEETMQALEAMGSEQTRKTYGRHGVKDAMFGVKFGDMKTLKKKIKTDHALALELWATGNHDARALALMIADPQAATVGLLEGWADDINVYVLSDSLSAYAAQTPIIQTMVERWTKRAEEWHGATGWNLLGSLAMQENGLPDSYFANYLDIIERDLHGAKNRVRYSMNNALIAIGGRSEALHVQAVKVAQALGQVIVDHGQTGCKTPDAVPYMEKMWARKGA